MASNTKYSVWVPFISQLYNRLTNSNLLVCHLDPHYFGRTKLVKVYWLHSFPIHFLIYIVPHRMMSIYVSEVICSLNRDYIDASSIIRNLLDVRWLNQWRYTWKKKPRSYPSILVATLYSFWTQLYNIFLCGRKMSFKWQKYTKKVQMDAAYNTCLLPVQLVLRCMYALHFMILSMSALCRIINNLWSTNMWLRTLQEKNPTIGKINQLEFCNVNYLEW